MKNRNDGGYSLALVLVVMAVIAVIATTLATVVLRNMDSQAQYTQRMQDQYEAQGKLEKVLAELTKTQIVELEGTLSGENHREAAIHKAIDTIRKTVDDENITLKADDSPLTFWHFDSNNVEVEYGQFENTPKTQITFTYDFMLTADVNDVAVTYDLQLKGHITYTDHSDGTTMFIITSPKITTKSVEVGGDV